MGGKQLGFTDYELTTAKKRTKREKFLSEMEAVVPWQALIDLIEPHYPKASKKGGRPPYPLATMLRMRWMAFIGQLWSLTSLTPGGRNRVRFQCRPLGEFCLPESCVALHGSTSKGSGPG